MALRRIEQKLAVGHKRFYAASWLNFKHIGRELKFKSRQIQNDSDVEKAFISQPIQNSLVKIASFFDAEKTLTNEYAVLHKGDSQFELMTDDMLAKTMVEVKKRSLSYLQCPPIMAPMSEVETIIDKDSDIAGHDQSKFIFTDISPGIEEHERTIVVRQPDGILRRATPAEHGRSIRIYYERSFIYPELPKLFFEPYKTELIEQGDYRYLLDMACNYLEPNDPLYVDLCTEIYSNIEKKRHYNSLYSTRYWSQMQFYLALNGRVSNLFTYFAENERFDEILEFIHMHNKLHYTVKQLNLPTNTLKQKEYILKFIENNPMFHDEKNSLQMMIEKFYSNDVKRAVEK